MISIKKYLDLDTSELNKYRPPSPEDLLAAMLEAYRAALGAMGNSGEQRFREVLESWSRSEDPVLAESAVWGQKKLSDAD